MPCAYFALDKIRAESTSVNETPDPNKCGCRNVRCCDENCHRPVASLGAVATKFWTFRWEYYFGPYSEYGWSGSKTRSYMTTRCGTATAYSLILIWRL